jgi:pullulanase
VKKVIQGMVDFKTLSDDPTEWQGAAPLNSINYISCHDGFTLYDKLILAAWCQYQEPGPTAPQANYPRSNHPQIVDFADRTQFPDEKIENKLQKMDKLGAAILLTSQGIPFLHSGAEFLRQKIKMYANSQTGQMYEFDSNSNTAPDAVNALRWELKAKHFDIFQYYQGLIHLRRAHPTFRRETAASVRAGLKIRDEWTPEEACVAYELEDPENQLVGETWKHVIVLINPYPAPKIFTIPEGDWKIAVNLEQAGVKTLGTCTGGRVEVAGISMWVLHE